MVLVLLAMMGYAAYIIYTDVREYERERKEEQERKEREHARSNGTIDIIEVDGEKWGVVPTKHNINGSACSMCDARAWRDCSRLPDCLQHNSGYGCDVIFKRIKD